MHVCTKGQLYNEIITMVLVISIYCFITCFQWCHTSFPSLAPCQELHKRAWDLVATYLATNLRFFAGAAKEAESTVLPLLTSYVDEAFAEIPECRSTDDHGVILWINLPCCGVVPVHKYEWCVTSVSNLLAIYRRNGLAILVHPNRGQVAERTDRPKVCGYG